MDKSMLSNMLKIYVNEEKSKLDKKEITSINLRNVNMSLIKEIFGAKDNLDLNGWQGDYWFNTEDGYFVSGCMYDGTATISIDEEE